MIRIDVSKIKNWVLISDILPIETEKNPYREVIKQLEELVRIKNGDEE